MLDSVKMTRMELRECFKKYTAKKKFHRGTRSGIFFGLFLAYFGSYVHRPRMIAASSLLTLLGCIFMFLPHYIADPYQYDGQIVAEGVEKGTEGVA